MNEILHAALKLLRRRDYTVRQLRHKLESRFGEAAESVFEDLLARRYLDDRRYARNFVARHGDTHPGRVREALEEAGVDRDTAEAAVAAVDWPSLRDVLKAKMLVWHLDVPLSGRDAARLFRGLSRLGYPEEEIREELERLHEQQ